MERARRPQQDLSHLSVNGYAHGEQCHGRKWTKTWRVAKGVESLQKWLTNVVREADKTQARPESPVAIDRVLKPNVGVGW